MSKLRIGFLLGIVCATLLASGAPPVGAQTRDTDTARDDEQSRIVDRSLGEEEQIRMREEWFWSNRRAGTDTAQERANLRMDAVRQTRELILQQRQRRTRGSEPAQNFWQEMGPSPSTFGGWTFGTVSGRVTSISADWAGGVLYVGTAAGGLWKSTNDGLSWTPLFDDAGTLTVGAAAVDQSVAGVIWVGTGDYNAGCESYFGVGMLRSGDGGLTWEQRNGSGGNTLEDASAFSRIDIDPRDSDKLVAGVRRRNCVNGSSAAGGIYTTDDAGLNWTKRLSSSVHDMQRDPSVADTLWAATDAGIYKSTDNGVSWDQQNGSGLPVGSGRSEIAIAPSDSNVVYALFTSSIWRTVDGGATWAQRASGSNACDGQCTYNMTIGVDPGNSDTVYRGTIRLFKTTDGGAGWSDLVNGWGSSQKVHQDIQELLVHPTQAGTFYVGSDGGLWKSINGGNSFTNINGNLNVTQFYAIDVDAADPQNICGGAQDNSSLARSTSNVWDLQQVTGDGFVCQYNPVQTNYAYIASYPSGGYPNVRRSTNGPFGFFGGITGSSSDINAGDRINWVTPYILDPVSPNIVWLGTHRLYRSDNHGSDWTQLGPDLTAGSGSLKVVEVNRNFPDRVFTGSASGRVWRTIDDTLELEDITSGLPGRGVNDVAGDPTNPDRAFAVVGGFNSNHLWEWNLGSGWIPRGADLPNVPANSVLMISDSEILVGNDVGVFRSFDGGQTFLPMMDGLPVGMVVTDLKYNIDQNLVTAGTYGRGAWQVSLAPPHPSIAFDSFELPLIEIDGNGDDSVEPGETWSGRVVVKNVGGEDALDVQARLSTVEAGITLIDDGALQFGSVVDAGATAASTNLATFIVDPGAACDDGVVFDLVDVTTSNDPQTHDDRLSVLTVTLGQDFGPPLETSLLDENFDVAPAGWTHEAVIAGVPPCGTLQNLDEWHLLEKDAARGLSYHNGAGPGLLYNKRDFAWLYYNGKDSENGIGVDIPAGAVGATLTIEHWYATASGLDGGKVVIDAIADDQDVYQPLTPSGGYPGGNLATNNCNGLEGTRAFQGSSGGWVTDTFDLMPYRGQKVYLAFVFGSGVQAGSGEGWYMDSVNVDILEPADPFCTIQDWPGSVGNTLMVDRAAPGLLDVTWGNSCNFAGLPTQGYSIQVGDLDQLHATGTYSHAPLADDCNRVSPATIAESAGNVYYLAVANEGGREGSAGQDAVGTPRPQASGVCGLPRDGTCP